jgi:hypothetical protein
MAIRHPLPAQLSPGGVVYGVGKEFFNDAGLLGIL